MPGTIMNFQPKDAVNNLVQKRMVDIKKTYNFMQEEKNKEDPNYKIVSSYCREIKQMAQVNLLDFLIDDSIIL